MRNRRASWVWSLAGIAMLAALFMAAGTADGHAVLKSSSPAANATVVGPDVPIVLKFNVRIDAVRSKIQLLRPDSTQIDLVLEKQTEPETLTTKAAELKPGDYKIRWQVLAPDGHITRGEIPFTVTGS